jgi:transposase-like protein
MSNLPSKTSLNANQRLTAELFATRDTHGKTIEEIAQEVGVSTRTIYRWKQDPNFIKYQNEVSDKIMEDFLTEVYTELRGIVRSSQSEKSKLKAIELVLSNRGKLKNTQEITHKVEEVFDPEKERKEIIDIDIDKL